MSQKLEKILIQALTSIVADFASYNEYYVGMGDLQTEQDMSLEDAIEKAKELAKKYDSVPCVHLGNKHIGDAFPTGEYIETMEHLDSPPDTDASELGFFVSD